ncbi:MAG: L-tyrosine/L-tryptophan isonitrile synthase family protein [bacterium]
MEKQTLKILAQFNTWKYKRAHPSKIQEMGKIIEDCAMKNIPIPLVGYWSIGNKSLPDKNEYAALSYLDELRNNVRKIYGPGIKITFIISDLHAKNNLIPDEKIKSYTEEIEKILANSGFSTIRLSELYKKYNLSIKKINCCGKIWWLFFPLKNILVKQAARVSLREDKNLCARQYALMRIAESKILEKEYKDYIFITYSSPLFKSLHPRLPTLYLYSIKKGCSEAPWFK